MAVVGAPAGIRIDSSDQIEGLLSVFDGLADRLGELAQVALLQQMKVLIDNRRRCLGYIETGIRGRS